MCAELDRILDLPMPCGCGTFICEHTPPFDPAGPTPAESAKALRRWFESEQHRYSCQVCFKERRAQERAYFRAAFRRFRLSSTRAKKSRVRPVGPTRPPRSAKGHA